MFISQENTVLSEQQEIKTLIADVINYQGFGN